MEVPLASIVCSSGLGGLAISYFYVATFEAGIGGLSKNSWFRESMHLRVSIAISNPLILYVSYEGRNL